MDGMANAGRIDWREPWLCYRAVGLAGRTSRGGYATAGKMCDRKPGYHVGLDRRLGDVRSSRRQSTETLQVIWL
jgi:hypothetical protein